LYFDTTDALAVPSIGRGVLIAIVSDKQRDHCKDCQYNFREGDGRTNEKIVAKKALCILLYGMAKAQECGMRPVGSAEEQPQGVVGVG